MLSIVSIALTTLSKVTGINIEAAAIKGAVSFVIIVGAYFAGVMHQKGIDKADTLRVELATAHQDLTIAQRAADTATAQTQTLEDSDARNQDQIHELETALAAKPTITTIPDPKQPGKTIVIHDPCNVDGDFLRRMRNLK